jgi:hypothetical protein
VCAPLRARLAVARIEVVSSVMSDGFIFFAGAKKTEPKESTFKSKATCVFLKRTLRMCSDASVECDNQCHLRLFPSLGTEGANVSVLALGTAKMALLYRVPFGKPSIAGLAGHCRAKSAGEAGAEAFIVRPGMACR